MPAGFLSPALALPLALLLSAFVPGELRAQSGCDDARATEEMARIRQEIGAPDVMCVEFARGDADGDGRDDAVLDIGYELPGTDGGGASRLYLLPGHPAAPLAMEPQAERGAVQQVRIDAGLIRVETLEHRADDAPCCPSLIREIVLRAQGGELVRDLDLEAPR
jgi:hypothetical protein